MEELKCPGKKELMELATVAAPICISLYVPTERAGRQTQKASIHLKNLLKEVETQLSELGLRWDDLAAILDEVRALGDDADFWQHQDESLAIFLYDGVKQFYSLPFSVPPRQSVSDSFDIVPLLPLLSREGRYYLLAISEADARLFLATHSTCTEVPVPGLPKGMAEALWADDNEKQLQWHSGAGVSSGSGRAAMYFGTGDEGTMKEKKIDYKRYFDKVDAALAPVLKADPAPMILAGVAYLLPIYRSANKSAHLLDDEIHGNKDRYTVEELHKASWPVAEAHFGERTRNQLKRYGDLASSRSASSDSTEIAKAARVGRVDTLLVAADPSLGLNTNRVVLDVLRTGGQIHVVDVEQIDSESGIAAIFRYEEALNV